MTADATTKTDDIDDESSEDETYYNAYLFADHIDLHLMSKAPEFKNAIDALCAGVHRADHRAKMCMNVLVANLYDAYKYSPERYVYLSMDENKLKAGSIYNRNNIGYDSLLKCIRWLVAEKYMTKSKPYYNRKYKDGYLTRLRSLEKLISLLEGKYGVHEDMLFVRDQEVLIVKDNRVDKEITFKGKDGVTRKREIKIKRLWDYSDKKVGHKVRAAMRGKVERYNKLLMNTYIDIDPTGYVPKAKAKETIYVDLARKFVRRIFNRRMFTKGGRFYGGWWQGIPSGLRKHIIINGHPVVEIDFSGMHIHILYHMKGLKLRDLGLIPYIYTKHDDPSNVRPYIKRIMLTAINCDKPKKCLRAVRRDIKLNPENYPEQPESKKLGKLLRKLRDQVIKYHSHISEYLNSGIGLKAQFIDSEIANEVISNLTKDNIPVLCVHDSFICMNIHKDRLLDEMKSAYIKIVNREILNKKKFDLIITPEEVESDLDTLIEEAKPWHSSNLLLKAAMNLGANSFPIIRRANIAPEQPENNKRVTRNYIANVRHTLWFTENPSFCKNEQLQRQLLYLRDNKCNFNKKIPIEFKVKSASNKIDDRKSKNDY